MAQTKENKNIFWKKKRENKTKENKLIIGNDFNLKSTNALFMEVLATERDIEIIDDTIQMEPLVISKEIDEALDIQLIKCYEALEEIKALVRLHRISISAIRCMWNERSNENACSVPWEEWLGDNAGYVEQKEAKKNKKDDGINHPPSTITDTADNKPARNTNNYEHHLLEDLKK